MDSEDHSQFRMPLINDDAPAFKAVTTQGEISFPEDYRGKWVILFSHPADFTPVCTTEFMTFASMIQEFKDLNTELIGLSVDSRYAHIASAYMQVLFNDELHQVALGQAELSKQQYARISRMREVGKASPAEVAEAKARVAQDETNVVQTENNDKLALLDLSQLIELETPEGFLVESPAAQLELQPLTPPDEIFQSAMTSKPSIQAAQYRLEGSKHNIRIAQSGFYPQISLNGSLGTNYYSTINRTFKQQMGDNFSKYLGFSLSVPLFNRLSTRNRVRAARLQRDNYALQLDNAKKTLYKEIQQAWYNAVASESKYKSSRTATEASNAAFLLTSEKYNNGKATAVEYNEAKQNLMQAQSDELQAKYDYLFRTKILDFYKGIPL